MNTNSQLDLIINKLNNHDKKFNIIIKKFNEHDLMLNKHNEMLKNHDIILKEHRQTFESINNKLEKIDKRLDNIEFRLDNIENRLTNLEHDNIELNKPSPSARLKTVEDAQNKMNKYLEDELTNSVFKFLKSNYKTTYFIKNIQSVIISHELIVKDLLITDFDGVIIATNIKYYYDYINNLLNQKTDNDKKIDNEFKYIYKDKYPKIHEDIYKNDDEPFSINKLREILKDKNNFIKLIIVESKYTLVKYDLMKKKIQMYLIQLFIKRCKEILSGVTLTPILDDDIIPLQLYLKEINKVINEKKEKKIDYKRESHTLNKLQTSFLNIISALNSMVTKNDIPVNYLNKLFIDYFDNEVGLYIGAYNYNYEVEKYLSDDIFNTSINDDINNKHPKFYGKIIFNHGRFGVQDNRNSNGIIDYHAPEEYNINIHGGKKPRKTKNKKQ
jgi:hypothetical protein